MDTDKPIKAKQAKPKKKQKSDYSSRNDEKWNKQLTSRERKKNQEEKMQDIDNYMDELMGMATAIGDEMNTQNKIINEAHDKMDDLDDQFDKKNRYMKRILRK